MLQRSRQEPEALVLIESDWNLKGYRAIMCLSCVFVLIESDWNLKEFKKLLKQAEEEAY